MLPAAAGGSLLRLGLGSGERVERGLEDEGEDGEGEERWLLDPDSELVGSAIGLRSLIMNYI